MIYFDENKEAYNCKETIEKWGKTCIFSCDNITYDNYLAGKYIWQNNELIDNPEWDKICLKKIKEQKIIENDNLRNKALIQGVTYQNILFDSDIDQKINLLEAISKINDEDTIEWFGMNNDSITCTKQDLYNIGKLVSKLHTFCWAKNAEIKALIAKAETIEEVNEIEINYTITGE